MELRRGRTRATYRGILGSAALAGAVALAAAGCAPSSASAKASTSASHALTLAEAQAIYNSYVTASTAAAKQGDATNGLAIVGDEQWSILHAQYTALATTGTPVPRYSYGRPVFYVPALPGYPLWFAVAVPVSTEEGGHLGPPVNTLMVFQKFNPGRQWTLDGTTVLDKPLPAMARDSDGYAVAWSSHDQGLLLPPDLVGPTQAAVVDEGPAAPAAAVIGAGPQTTGFYAAQNARSNSVSAQGLKYLWLLQAAAFARYELRTADGGALVLYAMYLNTQIEHPGDVSGGPIPVPASFAPLITTASAKVGHKGVTANWTYEFAAVDPPQTAHGAKVEVVAGSGAPTFGAGY